MKIRHTLILALLTICFSAIAQETPKDSDDIFVGGIKSFAQVMRTNISYPFESKRDGIEGLAIVQVNVSSDGSFTANYMTRLDEHIEQQLTRAVSASVSIWKANEENYTRYLAIAFNNGYYNFEILSKALTELPEIMSSPFLGIMQIRAPSNQLGKYAIKYYEKLRTKAEALIEKEQYKRAYEKLNEAIRFNPFNAQDIMLRQEMEQKLGLNTYRPYDLAWARALPRVVAQMKKE